MPKCKNVIIDSRGVMVGRICHIEGALKESARFNAKQTNEQRRALSNLLLLCSPHHTQIDSKQYEKKWTLAKLRKIKENHERQFREVGETLQRAFESSFVDSTEALEPTLPDTFTELTDAVPECAMDEREADKCRDEIKKFLGKMKLVPDMERKFMLGVIKRSIRLGPPSDPHHFGANYVLVDADDIHSALNISRNKIQMLGSALKRYSVGDFDLYHTPDEDRYHVRVSNPSHYVTWYDIAAFCEGTGEQLEDFVLHLKFGLLG